MTIIEVPLPDIELDMLLFAMPVLFDIPVLDMPEPLLDMPAPPDVPDVPLMDDELAIVPAEVQRSVIMEA